MYKQIIVVRADLRMGKGKLAAQCAHASLLALRLVEERFPEIAREWEKEGQEKIVLKVRDEDELMKFFRLASEAGIPSGIVRDAGRTQLEEGTVTCFGSGPWDEKELDRLFGKLKLL